MRIRLKWMSILSVIALVTLHACKEEEVTISSEPEPKSQVFIFLTSTDWIVYDFVVNGQSSWSIAPECNKDNGLRFRTEGTGENLTGDLKCDPLDTNTVFNWKLEEDSLVVISSLDSGNEPLWLEIDSISKSNLTFYEKAENGNEQLIYLKAAD